MSSPTKFDFSDAPLVGPEGDQMTTLRQLVKELVGAEEELKDRQADLELAKTSLADLRDHRVPDHCKSMGFGGGKVDGFNLNLKLGVYGGLSELDEDPAAKAAAFEYLEELGEGAVIKRVLTINLGKGQAELENRIRRGLSKLAAETGIDIEVGAKVDVHPSTLAKIARDRLEAGEDIDLKRLGLVKVTRATTKPVK